MYYIRVVTEPVCLHFVHRPGEQRMATFGAAQAKWLLDEGHIVLAEFTEVAPNIGRKRYEILGEQSIEEIAELVEAQVELRECDFCREHADWIVNTRPFTLDTFQPGPGPMKRPVFACDDCATLVRHNAKDELLELALARQIAYARAHRTIGHTLVPFTDYQLKQQIRPMVRELVTKTFANRQGSPERAA